MARSLPMTIVRNRASTASAIGTPTRSPRATAKVTAVRQMFDAIAPRYDLVNRIMTFRLDVRWRRKAVVAARARLAVATVVDLARGTGDLCAELATAGHRSARRSTSRYGMLAAATVDVPAGAGRHPPPPAPRRRGRRRDVRLRPAQPRRPRGVLRRARPGRAPGRPHRPARRRRSRATRLVRFGHGIYFGHVVPLIGGLLSRRRGLPLPAQERRLPARARRRCSTSCATPGSATPSTSRCRAASPSCSSAPAADDARRHRRARARPSTSTTSAVATACCSCATASAWPGAAWLAPVSMSAPSLVDARTTAAGDRRSRRSACRSSRTAAPTLLLVPA